VTINDQAGDSSPEGYAIFAGAGGNATGAGGKGGNTGNVTTVKLSALDSSVWIGVETQGLTNGLGKAGDGGTGATAAGGAGGTISKISGEVGTLTIDAANGGSSSDGTGGNGGSVGGLAGDSVLTQVTYFIQRIAAGNGGNSGAGKTAGLGGNISGITTVGDIGDFSALFGRETMGGLLAGQAGSVAGALINTAKNGSVTNIIADRIAAIVAGPNIGSTPDASNAVSKISGITATVIGADQDDNDKFSFVDATPTNGVFNIADGDTVTDGLIIVRSDGYTAPTGILLKVVTV
jgi:hypothetical protein